MFDLSRIANVIGGFLGDKAGGFDPAQIIEQVSNLEFDPAQFQELISQQVDLEALGLQDMNFEDMGVDQILGALSERGVDISQLDLGGLADQFGENNPVSALIGQFTQGGRS